MSCIRDVAFSFDQVICTMNISSQEELFLSLLKTEQCNERLLD